jgi:type IV fimbrial biogenesis protein FimT
LRSNQRGVTMIELMVALVVAAVLLALAVPALSSWVQNAQIRTTADAIQNGLQLARAEAVRLNTLIRFQLTSTIDNSCTLSTTSSSWVVSMSDPTSLCGTPTTITYTPTATDPAIIQVHPSAEGAGSTTNASQALVCFNGLGQQSSATPCASAPVTISVTNPAGGACKPAGTVKCLNVQVTTAGQIHMCDPSLTYSATAPTGC